MSTKCFADPFTPVTKFRHIPEAPNENGNYSSSVNVYLDSVDLISGTKSVYYRIDNQAWQHTNFNNTLNRVLNASFDLSIFGGLDFWSATTVNPNISISKETSQNSGFPPSSARIVSTHTGWAGINNRSTFAVTTAGQRILARAWVKTQNVSQYATMRLYAVTRSKSGYEYTTLVSQSNTYSGTTDWKKLEINTILNIEDLVGVYVDLGLNGPGTVWFDGVTLNVNTNLSELVVNIPNDAPTHSLSFYTVDNFNNTEPYSCGSPRQNCPQFNFDFEPEPEPVEPGIVRTTNQGFVKSGKDIIMTTGLGSETNTDALIEYTGTQIVRFTSEQDWYISSAELGSSLTYDEYSDMLTEKQSTDDAIPGSSGIYIDNNDFNINSPIASSTAKDLIIFVNGNLNIEENIDHGVNTKVLFIVKGDVFINKEVTKVVASIFSDSSFHSGYNVESPTENNERIDFEGVYSANRFYLERNDEVGSVGVEYFKYDPYYLLEFDKFFTKGNVEWIRTE